MPLKTKTNAFQTAKSCIRTSKYPTSCSKVKPRLREIWKKTFTLTLNLLEIILYDFYISCIATVTIKSSLRKFITNILILGNSTERFCFRNDLPVLVSHFYHLRDQRKERQRVLIEGRKGGGRILIQTESVYKTLLQTNIEV